MNLSFSFALMLHRVFDSAPPEKDAVFEAGGRRLRPHSKPGGLAVFVDEELPEEQILVRCPGYLDAWVTPVAKMVVHLRLFPAKGYLAPSGWEITLGHAPPGSGRFWFDPAYRVRLISRVTPDVLQLQVRPGFVGGCLGWSETEYAMIIEKNPPDRFRLDAVWPEQVEQVQKGYAALADEQGDYALVAPAGYRILQGDQQT